MTTAPSRASLEAKTNPSVTATAVAWRCEVSRSVICGINSSDESHKAAELGLSLARVLDARPILVHAVGRVRPPSSGDDAPGRGKASRAFMTGAQVLADIKVSDRAAYEDRLIPDKPAEALTTAAAEADAALIAVGSRHRGPVRRALFEGTARKTIRQAECPVLVVPARSIWPRPEEARALVCGVDGSEASLYAMRAAAQLSRLLNLELVLVHVQQPVVVPAAPAAIPPPSQMNGGPEPVLRAVSELIERVESELGVTLAYRPLVAAGPVVSELDRVAREQPTPMLVIGARRLDGLKGAAFRSVSARLCSTGSRPVLVVLEGASLDGHQAGSDLSSHQAA